MSKVTKPYTQLVDSELYLKQMPLPDVLMEGLKDLDFLIYGGFVRDLIAKAHNPSFKEGFADIDIILLCKSHNTLIRFLVKNGYTLGSDEHAAKVYRHWGAVRSCYTLLPDNGGTRIQLVVPMPIEHVRSPSATMLRDALIQPVIAVDLVCCGVAITPNLKLIEVVPGAVADCQAMQLTESSAASHKANLKERIKKLTARGWNSPILASKEKIEW
jgi:hypothetical protein